MSSNNHNSKERIAVGQSRRNYKLAMAWQWLKASHPDVADALAAEAVRKFPLISNNASLVHEQTTKGLNNALKALKAKP